MLCAELLPFEDINFPSVDLMWYARSLGFDVVCLQSGQARVIVVMKTACVLLCSQIIPLRSSLFPEMNSCFLCCICDLSAASFRAALS